MTRTKLRVFGLSLLAGIVSSLGSAAQADILFDSLSPYNQPYAGVQAFGGTTTQPLAASFSTTSATYMNEVTLELSTTGSSGGVEVFLESSPGTNLNYLGEIHNSSLSASPSEASLAFTPIALAANTTYWIELVGLTTHTEWWYTQTDNGPGVSGESYFYNGQTYPNSMGPDMMSVTAVPEPSTLVLSMLGIGILVGTSVVRRRRASR